MLKAKIDKNGDLYVLRVVNGEKEWVWQRCAWNPGIEDDVYCCGSHCPFFGEVFDGRDSQRSLNGKKYIEICHGKQFEIAEEESCK